MAIIGIDLGTTNSLAAYWKDGRAEVISCNGTTMFPSVVSMEEDGTVLVGGLVYSVKRSSIKTLSGVGGQAI